MKAVRVTREKNTIKVKEVIGEKDMIEVNEVIGEKGTIEVNEEIGGETEEKGEMDGVNEVGEETMKGMTIVT